MEVDLENSEKLILSYMLGHPKKALGVISDLSVEDFHNPFAKVIFEQITECIKNNLELDLPTLFQLASKRLPGSDGLPQYLSDISVATTLNVSLFVSELKERKKAEALKSLGKDLYQENSALSLIDISKKLDKAFNGDVKREFGYDDGFALICEALEAQHRGEMTGINTGFKELDDLIRGWQRGHLHILAARPGMGKTAFALTSFIHAIRNNSNCVFFSVEMPIVDIKKRMIAAVSGMDHFKLNMSPLPDDVADNVHRCIDKIASAKDRYLINDDKVGIDDIFNSCISAKSKLGKLDLIFVDYLQLMKTRDRDTREREIAEISEGLKHMAKSLKIAVVALAQLNRGVEARQDKRPLLSDLRDSGSIEQDADLVCFLYREAYYNRNSPSVDKRATDLIIAKNRHGECRDINLTFNYECMRFSDPSSGGK